MAATPISPVTRYTGRGTGKTYWLAACADYTDPTRAELDDGVDLTGDIMDEQGWGVTSAQIETPDKDTRYTKTIPGVITAAESTITMYADKEGDDSSLLMPRDETGFIVRLRGGDVPGSKMNVFPVTVSSISPQDSVDGSSADTNLFTFAITDEPAEGVEIPA